MNIAYAYITGCGCRQNFTRAIDICRDAVNDGIDEANYYAALCFEFGMGVDQDLDKALMLYGFAADADYVPGMIKAGQLNDSYYGYKDNKDRAIEFYERAAKKGSLDAQAELARIRFNEDKKSNFDTLKDLASRGSATASEAVAHLYEDGENVNQDKTKALQFYIKAADNGSLKAAREIVRVASENGDKALEIKYADKIYAFRSPNEYFARAKKLFDDGEGERAAFWYSLGGLSAKKETNMQRAEEIIKTRFEKNAKGEWSKKN